METFLRIAWKQSPDYAPHIRLLPESPPRQGFFEPHHLDAMLAHLPPDLQDVTLFGYHTGWRKGEILGLQWRDVDLDAGVIRLPAGTTKTGEGRVITLAGEVGEIIHRRESLPTGSHCAKTKR